MIEDSDEDYQIATRAFSKAGLDNPIYRCADGDTALDYLYQRGNYNDSTAYPKPKMIVLDLNLPGTDGRDVLKEIKSKRELRSIPVVVLTNSSSKQDIHSCYKLGANSYIEKPVDIEGFTRAIEKLKEYWFHIVHLPTSEN